jgi:hypothetical protein
LIKSTAAALLSALLLPGLGHLYLKGYIRGALLVLVSLGLLYSALSTAVDPSLTVVEQMGSGRVSMNGSVVLELMSKQVKGAGQSLGLTSMLMLVLWLIGVVDAFRIGRAMEDSEPGGEHGA